MCSGVAGSGLGCSGDSGSVRTGVYFSSVSRIGELGYESTFQDYHLGILVEQIYALNTILSVGRSVLNVWMV